MTDNMIERVARAMCAADGGSPEVDVHYYIFMARAAIEAMREPTDSMTNGVDYRRGVWVNMIAAALRGEK
jgi:hypothetical protein